MMKAKVGCDFCSEESQFVMHNVSKASDPQKDVEYERLRSASCLSTSEAECRHLLKKSSSIAAVTGQSFFK